MAKYSIREFLSLDTQGRRVADLEVDDDCSAIEEATRLFYAAQAYRAAPARLTITKGSGTKIATLLKARDGSVRVSFS